MVKNQKIKSKSNQKYKNISEMRKNKLKVDEMLKITRKLR